MPQHKIGCNLGELEPYNVRELLKHEKRPAQIEVGSCRPVGQERTHVQRAHHIEQERVVAPFDEVPPVAFQREELEEISATAAAGVDIETAIDKGE